MVAVTCAGHSFSFGDFYFSRGKLCYRPVYLFDILRHDTNTNQGIGNGGGYQYAVGAFVFVDWRTTSFDQQLYFFLYLPSVTKSSKLCSSILVSHNFFSGKGECYDLVKLYIFYFPRAYCPLKKTGFPEAIARRFQLHDSRTCV